jgi:hypothetical protein
MQICGVASFDWQQKFIVLPQPVCDSMVCAQPASGVPLVAGSSDPPPGGYLHLPNTYPFYYNYENIQTQCAFGEIAVGLCVLPVMMDDTSLNFYDLAGDPCFPSNPDATKFCDSAANGNFIEFQTTLVGVDFQGNPVSLPSNNSFFWKTTYDGSSGGVYPLYNNLPADPGTGTGGVTILSINGVVLPPSVDPSRVLTTASGLVYSRVTQTFQGRVTLTNISSSAVSGPIQILFFGMPATVTLVNATGNLPGTPYLTIPGSALAPGQSITVPVQFKNPSNATINFTPAIYSGSIN